MEKQGVSALSLKDVKEVLRYVLSNNCIGLSPAVIKHEQLNKVLPILKTGRYQEINHHQKSDKTNHADLDQLKQMPYEKAKEHISLIVLTEVSSILGVRKSDVLLEDDLSSKGMDSLMAFELAVNLEGALKGISISGMSMSQVKTSEDIVRMLLRNIFENQDNEDIDALMKLKHAEVEEEL
jgi:acyl carrier protein